MMIYHIEFAKIGYGISGGEKNMLESVKYFSKRGHKNIILTTDNGEEAYRRIGIISSENIEFHTIKSYAFEQSHHIFISYVQRMKSIRKLLDTISIEDGSVIICTSNFFPNSIPTWLLGRKYSNTTILYWHSVLPPRLLHGYMGEFSGKFRMPNLALAHYHANQFLYIRVHRKDGIALTPSKAFLLRVQRSLPNRRVELIAPYGGLDDDSIVKDVKKIYDVGWMGRFQNLKGLNDFIDVAAIVVTRLPDTKFLVIGGGDKKEVASFQKSIKENRLESNIVVAGFLTNLERYSKLKQAKLLAVTSYYESYGIVNVEALKLGLPLIGYDLPTYSHITKGFSRIKLGDKNEFANKIVEVLANTKLLKKLSKEAADESLAFSWDRTNGQLEKIIASRDKAIIKNTRC